MPLWSKSPSNLKKPSFDTSGSTRNVIATNRGWEYFDGKKRQLLVPIRNLSNSLGDNFIYKIYPENRLYLAGTHQNALIYVEFVKPYALVANPQNNAVVSVQINDDDQINFYFQQGLSSPLGGLAIFVAPTFSYDADDYVRISTNSLQYFSDVFASSIPSENINFTISNTIVINGQPSSSTSG